MNCNEGPYFVYKKTILISGNIKGENKSHGEIYLGRTSKTTENTEEQTARTTKKMEHTLCQFSNRLGT